MVEKGHLCTHIRLCIYFWLQTVNRRCLLNYDWMRRAWTVFQSLCSVFYFGLCELFQGGRPMSPSSLCPHMICALENSFSYIQFHAHFLAGGMCFSLPSFQTHWGYWEAIYSADVSSLELKWFGGWEGAAITHPWTDMAHVSGLGVPPWSISAEANTSSNWVSSSFLLLPTVHWSCWPPPGVPWLCRACPSPACREPAAVPCSCFLLGSVKFLQAFAPFALLWISLHTRSSWFPLLPASHFFSLFSSA